MITTKSAIIYITSDGKEFVDKDEAKEYEARMELMKIAPSGGELYNEDVVDFIINEWEAIERIMLGSE